MAQQAAFEVKTITPAGNAYRHQAPTMDAARRHIGAFLQENRFANWYDAEEFASKVKLDTPATHKAPEGYGEYTFVVTDANMR